MQDRFHHALPDSAKDFEEYKRFMLGLTKVMLEGRKEGATLFAVDLNILIAFFFEDEEMKEIFGPLCWYGTDTDLGSFLNIDVAGDYEGVQL